jgi:hypothetical protein
MTSHTAFLTAGTCAPSPTGVCCETLSHRLSCRCCATRLASCPDRLLHLGRSAAGRQNITEAMRLCGTSDTALPNREAVMGLQEDIIGTFQGLAQVQASGAFLFAMPLGISGSDASHCCVFNHEYSLRWRAGYRPQVRVGHRTQTATGREVPNIQPVFCTAFSAGQQPAPCDG